MSRKNWEAIAANQFKSLSTDIQEDWGDLRDLTLKQSR